MKMDPIVFYKDRLKEISGTHSDLKRKAATISLVRFIVFILFGASIYFLYPRPALLIPIELAIIGMFLYLVSRYNTIKRSIAFHQQLIGIQTAELNGFEGDHSAFDGGKEFISGDHPYNQDLDLFGPSSLFERINRTRTINGKKMLAAFLNSNDIENIQKKQEAIQELRDLAVWRQEFQANAGMTSTEISSDQASKWFHEYQSFVPKVFGWIPLIYGVISITTVVFYFLDIVSYVPLTLLFIGGYLLVGPYFKRVTSFYNDISRLNDTFSQYSILLNSIDTHQFNSELLSEYSNKLNEHSVKASTLLKGLSSQVDLLGNRNNMLFGFLANGFLLWDLYHTHKIEKWIEQFDTNVDDWFKCIEFFDAMNSFANYSFNHPEFILPKISAAHVIKADRIGHPMISASKNVMNSISLSKQDFLIITGANMAGKSTFLRTLGSSIVMANCGLPVHATTFEYTPIKLISSMRTSDSLAQEESYFYSELKRLKTIVDEINKEPYFLILDEILKGTNSHDKAEGSWKFVERIMKTETTGIIATHDLSLCELENKHPNIHNYYFDAEIINDELHFDYTLKMGVCKNMNASFLLRKMNITE